MKRCTLVIIYTLLGTFGCRVFVLRGDFTPDNLGNVTAVIRCMFSFGVNFVGLLIGVPVLIITFFLLSQTFTLHANACIAMFSITVL